jgi:hypothetical protein
MSVPAVLFAIRYSLLALLLGLDLPPVTARGESITATLLPADPVVGVTKVSIAGRTTPGARVVDVSTFPDGSVNVFSATADAAGAYTDGPFVLQQLGTYRDVLHDSATGASVEIAYAGAGDFGVTVEPRSATITTGGEVRFEVTFKSVGGFGGEVVAQLPASSTPPGAAVTWSTPRVKVPPNGSATAVLTILTLISTAPGTYTMAIAGTSGSVVHPAEPAVALTVNAPEPGTITATLSPARPIVGVTAVRIEGRATAGQMVIDTSTFPDGNKHEFVARVSGAGTYNDGPFVLRQLGIYHDVLLDGATGATAEISYQGTGDFSTAVDCADASIVSGEEANFTVTFKSLSGFAGPIAPAVPDLARIPGAAASWSSPAVTVRSGQSIAAGLVIKSSADTPPGTYTITVQGRNGSVTHAVPCVLTVTAKK